MTTPDPKRFDLIAALEGRTYPEETVTVFLDDAKMYAYAKARQTADLYPLDEEKQKIADDIRDAFKQEAIKITARTAPRHVIKAIEEEIEKEFPTKITPFGMVEPNQARNDAFNLRIWATYIVKIEASNGDFSVPSPAEVELFRNAAPKSALEAVAKAIDGLFEITQSGYEQIVQDPDFL